MKKTIEIANEIKQNKTFSLHFQMLMSFLISSRISPYIAAIYIRKKVIPNIVTLHMIFAGIIGAILFIFDNIWIKLLGAIFFHLWFILDCADGEVARYTKIFSKYGQELDFTAHIINHPLFTLSLVIAMIQTEKYNSLILIILFSTCCILDLYNRNLITLHRVIRLMSNTQLMVDKDYLLNKKNILKIIGNLFWIYPNVVLMSVIFYFIDTDLVFITFVLNLIFSLFMFTLSTIKWIKNIMKGDSNVIN